MQYAQILAFINTIKKSGLGSFAKIIAIIILVFNLMILFVISEFQLLIGRRIYIQCTHNLN